LNAPLRFAASKLKFAFRRFAARVLMCCILGAGVAFTSDLIGYSGGVSNGVGPAIYKTTDGARLRAKCLFCLD